MYMIKAVTSTRQRFAAHLHVQVRLETGDSRLSTARSEYVNWRLMVIHSMVVKFGNLIQSSKKFKNLQVRKSSRSTFSPICYYQTTSIMFLAMYRYNKT